MEAHVKTTEKTGKLKEYLEPRTQKITKTGENTLKVQVDNPEKLSRIPGIKEYTVDGETFQGLGGTPIHSKALAKIENREDAARAFLATIDGYTLYIVNSNRFWDIQVLKQYNSEIIELKNQETAEMFNIQHRVNYGENNIDLSKKELLKIYTEFLTH